MPHSSDRNNLRQPPVNCQSIRYPGRPLWGAGLGTKLGSRYLPPLRFPGPGLSIHRKCVNYADVALEREAALEPNRNEEL
jgi:hypothetical protein